MSLTEICAAGAAEPSVPLPLALPSSAGKKRLSRLDATSRIVPGDDEDDVVVVLRSGVADGACELPVLEVPPEPD
jgi:hypothetical protein